MPNEQTLTGDFRARNFRDADLRRAVFRKADLYRVSFAGADLRGAIFDDCFAAEADFTNAKCGGMQAVKSNFFQAKFTGADLSGSLLRECVLASADLRGANLRGITITLNCDSFEGATLDGAASAQLAYLFTRANSPHRERWLDLLNTRDLRRLERIFAR